MGYDQDKGAHTFRSENVRARLPRRRKRPADKTSEEENQMLAARSPYSSSDRTSPDPVRSILLVPSISIDLETLAMNEYLHRYGAHSEEIPDSLCPFLGGLLMKRRNELSNTEETFSLAFAASTLAFFASSRTIPSTMALASVKYGNALKKLKIALADTRQAASDEILLAVMLMGKYEAIICDFDPRRLSLKALHHMDGATALVRLRKLDKSRSDLDRSIDVEVRRQILRQAIYRCNLIPEWLQSGADFGEMGSDLTLDSCLINVAALRHSTAKFFGHIREASQDTDDSKCVKIQQIMLKAQRLDDMLLAWSLTAPPEFDYEALYNITDKRTKQRGQGSAKNYITRMTMWNRYRGARLVANCSLERLASCLLCVKDTPIVVNMQDQIKEVRQNAQMLVDGICTTVPCIMDDIESPASAPKAFVLAWPLVIASVTPAISDEQRDWIKTKLRLISEITRCATFKKLAGIDLHKRQLPLVATPLEVRPEERVVLEPVM